MTHRVEFTVPGRPTPKARARVVRGGAYTPARTREYEDRVGWCARQAFAGQAPFREPVELSIRAVFTKRNHGDFGNIVKAVEDALEGIAYLNDRQVLRWGGGGIYYGREDHAVVSVRPLTVREVQEEG